jgi:hypothetical protein
VIHPGGLFVVEMKNPHWTDEAKSLLLSVIRLDDSSVLGVSSVRPFFFSLTCRTVALKPALISQQDQAQSG